MNLPLRKSNESVLPNRRSRLWINWSSVQNRVRLAGNRSKFGRTGAFQKPTGAFQSPTGAFQWPTGAFQWPTGWCGRLVLTNAKHPHFQKMHLGNWINWHTSLTAVTTEKHLHTFLEAPEQSLQLWDTKLNQSQDSSGAKDKQLILEFKDGVVVRALASHQCGLGWITRLGVVCGLSSLIRYSAPRGFRRVLRFYPLLKNQQFIWIDLGQL